MKNAEAVRNVGKILEDHRDKQLVVVVSAMGKTTNDLEAVLHCWFEGEDYTEALDKVRNFHQTIIREVFPDGTPSEFLFDALWSGLEARLEQAPSQDFDFEYDQVVSYGELMSTAIVESWLSTHGFGSEWVDVRNIIRTNSRYRKAAVDWRKTNKNGEVLKGYLREDGCDLLVTQGFIASGHLGNTTTLGREGSDFSASILAHVIDAQEVTIWKDVEGMQNADPRWFNNTLRLPSISYREAIELSYYGASVIHPKTLQPLQEKNITLNVRSFLKPETEGTVIQSSSEKDHLIPSYIFKSDQVLVTISARDLSFIAERNLADIFNVLSDIGLNMNLMQLSALNFSFVMDKDDRRLHRLQDMLTDNYELKYNEDVQLLTVRHYHDSILDQLTLGKEILLEQRTRSTVRMILRDTEAD